MTAQTVPLTIEQGATFQKSFTWCFPGPDENTPGPPHDLTGYVGRMQIRKKQKDPVLVDASTTNGRLVFGIPQGGGVADLTNGRIMINLSDDDTDLLTSKSAVYDLEVEDSNGVVYRLLKGPVTVDPNVTQEIEDPPVEG